MDFTTITFEKDGNIGIIILNRPEIMNAINQKLITELDVLFDEIAKDEEIYVVIITGNKVFAAGADINELSALINSLDAHSFVTKAQALFNKIDYFCKPVIAAVNGFALGGGCELALACDIRIADENATFGQPEIKIGLMPGLGGTQRLPRLIGLGGAKELLYTGDSINAQEAYRVGLVNKIVPVELLMDEARKMAFKIIKLPQIALQMTKKVLNEGINMDLRSALALEGCCFAMLFSTEDKKEGIEAFLEKRKPVFKGK